MPLIALVAHDPSRLIGKEGELPWHLPADLQFFKETTSGHAIIMGRKTYDSIGRPLPKRRNLVLTRDSSWTAEGVEILPNVAAAVNLSAEQPDKPFYLIGGAEIYRQALSHLDELIVTHVHQEYSGDTYFPPYQDRFVEEDIILETSEFVTKRWLPKQRG